MSRWLAALCAVLFVTTAAIAVAQEEGPTLPPEVIDPTIATEELTLRLVPLTVDELAAAAAEWQGIVKAKTEEVVAAQIAVTNGDAAARDRVAALTEERQKLFADYRVVVDSWEKKGGDAAAIAQFRAYRNSILLEETRTADAQTLIKQATDWALSRDGGVQLLIDAGVIIASLLGLIIVARVVRRMARRWFGKVPNLSRLLQGFLSMVVYWIVLSIGLMIVLSAVGVDISPVFALFGGAAFIFAFALQDTLGNLAAGVMIMLNRPFDEGDYVDIAGTAGTVKSVNVSSTTVTTPDNQVIVIPNKNVWGNTITNVTTSPTRRVDLMFGIGYEDSIEKAQAVLERLVAAHPLTLDDPAPVIRVHALGESSVDFIVRPWVKGADYWSVYWDLTRQVKEAFDAEGISIPFPQRDVHIKAEAGGAGPGVSAPSETVSRGGGATAAYEEG
jgi:small conductance mechanosensitive channel